jgi:hypothetical protein
VNCLIARDEIRFGGDWSSSGVGHVCNPLFTDAIRKFILSVMAMAFRRFYFDFSPQLASVDWPHGLVLNNNFKSMGSQ